MTRLIDHTGQRFGRLTVTGRAEKASGARFAAWSAVCDCGATKVVLGVKLRRGLVLSCGCLRNESQGVTVAPAGAQPQRMNFGDSRLPARFWDKVTPCPMTGCWLWLGAVTHNGYGNTSRGRRSEGRVLAHRCTYEAVYGAIDPGLEADHLCRVRCCVNPDHIEPVTRQVNQKRGFSPLAVRARATHCPRGHEYAVYGEIYRGYRRCTVCRKDRSPRQRLSGT